MRRPSVKVPSSLRLRRSLAPLGTVVLPGLRPARSAAGLRPLGFIIRDRDDKFGADFDRAAKGVGAKVIRTAVKAPLMNATMARYVGSARREALDHVIILGARHMKSVVEEYSFGYFNTARPHPGPAQRIPVSTPRQSGGDASKVAALPVLGGLHHNYRAAA